MNDGIKEMLIALVVDPGRFLWIISAINLLTLVVGLHQRIWNRPPFRFFALAQLLVFPSITALAFAYAIRPPAY